ncbi:MAG: L-threonylcarbamoyladenylate synthase [Colwellia sp.]|nr:L-threonylcarbamoyladenylate synthase [Colwellia sp.]MCW8865455.1 L-threonylcarbamoyladenylate synthase [Colwellia sp.]MCW9082529.1 L-threonylcarbamoyladenylate synthase [Colwellia sp.]
MSAVYKVFQEGGIIAYPTEAVFGLGCDPDNSQAIEKLLNIKNRSKEKGLILLAGDFKQLLPYLDISKISKEQIDTILSRWPNAITQVLPANPALSSLLTGRFKSIAVRITDHEDVVALCLQTNKPIVSTSANLSGQAPALTWQQVAEQLSGKVDYIIKSTTSGLLKPSTIIDGLTGEVLRN